MAETICLDASVMLKLVLAEPGSEEAEKLVEEALRRKAELAGPGFLLAEALSVLRGRVQRGRMAPDEAEQAMTYLLALPVTEVSGPEIYRLAWQIAGELSLPVVYDAVYLAVAERLGAKFWTADRALFDRAHGKGYLHLLGGEK